MTYTYCAETTELTDAEVVAIIRHYLCCDEGLELEEGALNMLDLKAGCDLAAGHSGPHAGFQAHGPSRRENREPREEDCAWLFWGGAVREIGWPAECPDKDEHDLNCMLFDGHEGAHLHYGGKGDPPAWLRHQCRPEL